MKETTTASVAPAISIAARQGSPSHLVVLFHGVGANAADFQEIARALHQSVPRAEFLVPDGFHAFDSGGDGNGRQWFSLRGVTPENRPQRVREAGAEASSFIDRELTRRGLSGDQLVVGGFSQGAIVAAWLGVHRAPRPAALLMFSGRVAEDQPPVIGNGPRVFIAHGDRDPVMPVAEVPLSTRTLETWGAQVTARVYPGLAHQIDAREMRDAAEFLAKALADH